MRAPQYGKDIETKKAFHNKHVELQELARKLEKPVDLQNMSACQPYN